MTCCDRVCYYSYWLIMIVRLSLLGISSSPVRPSTVRLSVYSKGIHSNPCKPENFKKNSVFEYHTERMTYPRTCTLLVILYLCRASFAYHEFQHSKYEEVNSPDSQSKRLNELSLGCAALRQSGDYFKPYWRVFFLNSAKTVAFCPVPKTASSWWITTFARENGLEIEGMEEVTEYSNLMSKKTWHYTYKDRTATFLWLTFFLLVKSVKRQLLPISLRAHLLAHVCLQGDKLMKRRFECNFGFTA